MVEGGKEEMGQGGMVEETDKGEEEKQGGKGEGEGKGRRNKEK